MASHTAITTLPGAEAATSLGAALERMQPEPFGVGVFEIEDGSGLWEVGAYFDAPPDGAALALIAAAFGAAPFAVSLVPDVDWVAHVRRELPPVRAGRFLVHGAHDADKVTADCVPLLIEAAMAFGTGHHGTTQGCLRLIDRLASGRFLPGQTADIGCGTAVLAMAAARVLGGGVLATDNDPTAIEVARENIARNGLAGRIDCAVAEGISHPEHAARAPFGLVLANILKGPLIQLAPEVAANQVPGGMLVLSGLLNEQAPDVLRVYSEQGYNEVAREVIVDWTSLLLGRV